MSTKNNTDANFEVSAKNWVLGQELRIEHIKANIDNDIKMVDLHTRNLVLLKESLEHEEKCLADYNDFLRRGL